MYIKWNEFNPDACTQSQNMFTHLTNRYIVGQVYVQELENLPWPLNCEKWNSKNDACLLVSGYLTGCIRLLMHTLSLTSSVSWKVCHVFRVCCDWCCHGVTLCVDSIVRWRFEIRFCFEDKIWLRFFILTYVCGFLTSVTNTGVSIGGGVPRHYAYLFWVVGGGMGPPSRIHFEVRFFLFEKIYPPCPLWKHNVGHWCVGMPHIMGFPTHLASCSNLHILHDYMFWFGICACIAHISQPLAKFHILL